MNPFKFLVGGTKAAEKVIDAGVSGIDKFFYTEEEKADYHRELQKLHLEFIKVTATESTAQSISRRLICLPVVYSWLLMIFASVGLQLAGMDTGAVENAVKQMAIPSLASIGFYVGRHMVQK